MKTMKLNDSIRRVKEDDTKSMLNSGWSFCPKKEWKDNVRVTAAKSKEEKRLEKVKKLED